MLIPTAFELLLHVSMADASHSRENLTLHQSVLMNKCIQLSKRPFIYDYLCTDAARKTNPCTWRGVTCANGMITSWTFSKLGNSYTWEYVDMDWLPGTLRYIHLFLVKTIQTMNIKRLPRELRYFHSSYISAVPQKRESSLERIALRYLPEKIEELFLFDRSFLGTIIVSNLPSTMRILCITPQRARNCFIDMGSLPRDLEFGVTVTSPDNSELVSLDGTPLDGLLSNVWGKIQVFKNSSKYYTLADAQSHLIRSQMKWLIGL